MNKKDKKFCTTLNYIEHFLILGSTVTQAFPYQLILTGIVGIPIRITNSAIELKIYARTAGIKKYKLIIKKKKVKYDKIVLLAKSKLNNIKALISKGLIDSVIIKDEFVSVNNVLKEYNGMKEEIKNLKT